MFSPTDSLSDLVSPFLLLDYHAPYVYGPTSTPRGVGVHPHRGFENHAWLTTNVDWRSTCPVDTF
jgi:redox-sensitive bicupin YhaK (pirin superfamily)